MSRRASSLPTTAQASAPPSRALGWACVAAVLGIGSGVGIGFAVFAAQRPSVASDVSTWGVDVTHALPPSQFVRMHNTICTRDPLVLGATAPPAALATLDAAPGIGSGSTADVDVALNTYVGEAHAFCYALAVEGMDYNFRVGTPSEVHALTAVVPLPPRSLVLTFASSDGDDYELGQVRTQVQFDHVRPQYVDPLYSYDYVFNAPRSPPSPPVPDAIPMQTFMGADMETNHGVQRVLEDPTVAYCCSGLYTKMDSEGAS
jgi:hypothetical protein